jgi:predicted AAA+ superfamily ATPase
VAEALGDTRVVLVDGARQAGKSTIVARAAVRHDMALTTFDNPDTLDGARRDPVEFVRLAPRMVIDEVQRYPEVLLSIKELVDREFVPGRFLLTGSARVLGLQRLPDTLVGRMQTITLWPLSQGEIDSSPDGFVDAILSPDAEIYHESDLTRGDYVDRVVRGGFPEAVARAGRRRRAFYDAYLADLINRDVIQLSEIRHGREIRRLLSLVAARTGQLLETASLASALQISRPTVDHYLSLLEAVFLMTRIPAWSRNTTTRTVKAHKAALIDSGIATAVLNHDAMSLTRPDAPFGALLEGFVMMEIARQLTWSDAAAQMYHFRTKDKVEVDLVLETPGFQIVGIEVKATSTPRAEDFSGLRHLQSRVGADFLGGYLLHTGPRTITFGPQLRAVPISAIWQTTKPARE